MESKGHRSAKRLVQRAKRAACTSQRLRRHRGLNEELPKMEGAVAERGRDYFEDAMGRMLDFSQQWGFKSTDNPALTRYTTCTEAVSDFLVVGLCRIIPNGDVCEPRLAPRFDSNLKRCRE